MVPTTRKRNVYDFPAVAAKEADPIVVVAPLTLFCKTNVIPLIDALYQLLLSVHRSTAPRFVVLYLLMKPLKRTSASVTVEPSTALKIPLPFETFPALLTIEKTLEVLAPAPQLCPSLAVPQ